MSVVDYFTTIRPSLYLARIPCCYLACDWRRGCIRVWRVVRRLQVISPRERSTEVDVLHRIQDSYLVTPPPQSTAYCRYRRLFTSFTTPREALKPHLRHDHLPRRQVYLGEYLDPSSSKTQHLFPANTACWVDIS